MAFPNLPSPTWWPHWSLETRLFVCLFVICLSRLKFWQLFSWCGPAIPTHPPTHIHTEDSHNTGNFIPYSSRIVCGFFNVPQGTNEHGSYRPTRTETQTRSPFKEQTNWKSLAHKVRKHWSYLSKNIDRTLQTAFTSISHKYPGLTKNQLSDHIVSQTNNYASYDLMSK